MGHNLGETHGLLSMGVGTAKYKKPGARSPRALNSFASRLFSDDEVEAIDIELLEGAGCEIAIIQ